MARTTDLRPFGDHDEHDVINLFGYRGLLDRGTLVKPSGSGWITTESDIASLGAAGNSYANTVSQRFGVKTQVVTAGTGDAVLGMTLYDVKEQDENNEQLLFNPQKREELNAVLSGQAVPIVTKGYFLYSGSINGATTANQPLFPSGNGLLTTNPVNQIGGSSAQGAVAGRVGKTIGATDSKGWTLIYLNVQ
jgi:hypothetical protein